MIKFSHSADQAAASDSAQAPQKSDDSTQARQKSHQASVLKAEALGEPFRKGAERQCVLLVDNIRLTRECLGRQLHECCPEFDILAVATSNPLSEFGVEGVPDIAIVNAHASAFSNPDLDEEIRHLRAHLVPLIAIVEGVDQARADEAARQGLSGIFPGDGSIDLLAAAIRLVLAGGRFLPTVRDDVSTIEGFIASDAKLEAPEEGNIERDVAPIVSSGIVEEQARIAAFTAREGEILSHLVRGSPNKSIARDLGISESTVKAHLRHIMQKLGAANRTEAVSRLIEGKMKNIDAD